MRMEMVGTLRSLRMEARCGLFCLTLSLLAATAASAAPKMPPGSFLRQPAESVQALKRQINDDPLVCKRYARLYKMPVADVREAFAHLRLTRLTQDHVFQIHYIHPGERIGYKVRRVRKGTPIYSFEDGTPVLVKVCGNPVRKQVSPSHRVGLPSAETEMPPAVAEFDENEAMETVPFEWMTEMNGLRSGPPAGELPPPLDFVEVPDIPVEAPIDTSTTRLHRQPPVQQVHNWGNGGLFLLPLAAVPFLFGGGGGSSATPAVVPPIVNPPVVNPPVVPPPPITPVGGLVTPEPGTITLLMAVAFVGGVAIRTYRRRKSGMRG